MQRILLHLPVLDFPIYSYGFMIMTGFVLAMWVGTRRARLLGIAPHHIIDTTLLVLVVGVIGARMMYVVHYWERDGFARLWEEADWGRNLLRWINIRQGGLEFYGGLLLGVPAGILFLRRRRIPLGIFTDLGLSTVPLGLVFGRMGCFLNGCCFGRRVEAGSGLWKHLAVAYPRYESSGLPSIPYHQHLALGWVPTDVAGVESWTVTSRHLLEEQVSGSLYGLGEQVCAYTQPLLPAQLVGSLGNLLLFLFLAWVWSRHYQRRSPSPTRPRQGEVALLTIVLYSVLRILLEFLREDSPPFIAGATTILGKQGLTISQTGSLALLAVFLPAYLVLRWGPWGARVEPVLPPPASADAQGGAP